MCTETMLGFTLYFNIQMKISLQEKKSPIYIYIYDHFVCIGNLILTVNGRLFFIIKLPNKILASLTISMQ